MNGITNNLTFNVKKKCRCDFFIDVLTCIETHGL